MSDTLWVLFEDHSKEDDTDHSQMLNYGEELDALATQLGETPLSRFYDWTDYQFQLAEDDQDQDPAWIDENSDWHLPAPAAATLQALITALESKQKPFDISNGDREDLLEEMRDCLQKLHRAPDQRFHLCVVM